MKPDFAAPYIGTEARVELADDIERRILWLTNRQWISKTQKPIRRPEGSGEDLATRVQVLEEQLAAAQDQSLRVAADLQNVRRRAEQDVEKAHKFALEKFASDLLPIVDSLERGLELSNPDDESIRPMREGIELTLKMFHDTLKRYQLEAIDPHGEPFNADHHQAMAMQESADVEPNSVLKVFQKGYQLNGRLLAPGHGRGQQGAMRQFRLLLMSRLEISRKAPI